jgi:hypothetical protein
LNKIEGVVVSKPKGVLLYCTTTNWNADDFAQWLETYDLNGETVMAAAGFTLLLEWVWIRFELLTC